MIKFDAEEVWLWYHHFENNKKLELAKGEYCRRYALSKNKYANMQYILKYCKETSPARYKKIMEFADEYDKRTDGISIPAFAKLHRLKKDDFYVALRHREYNYLILKRIAENHPAPELREALPKAPEVDVNLSDPELVNQEVMVDGVVSEPIVEEVPETPVLIDEPKSSESEAKSVIEKWREMRAAPNPDVIAEETQIDPEALDEPTLFETFEHLAVDEEAVKPRLSLSDFISKRKLAEEPTAIVHFDEADELERLSEEYEESASEKPEPIEPPKKGRKPKEPLTFHAINPTPLAIDEDFGRIGAGEWSDKPLAPNIHPEPEITIRGNRIELTFTKSVRMTASPDTPHQKLLDIITLLKDL